MDGLGQQLLAGAGFAQYQHRGLGARRAPGLGLEQQPGFAGADQAAQRVFGTPRLGQLVPGVGQLAVQLVVARHQRRQALGVVQQHQAQRALYLAVAVAQWQAQHDKGFGTEVHDVEHDGLAAFHHFAHLAIGQKHLDRLPDRRRRIAQAQAARVFVVHPADARLPVDDQRAFADR